MIATAIALVLSLGIWRFWYGLEIAMNGGDPSLLRLPCYVFEEFTWLLPGGMFRKLLFVRKGQSDTVITENDVYLALTLPGWHHFVLTHVLLPFGPAAFVYWVIQ